MPVNEYGLIIGGSQWKVRKVKITSIDFLEKFTLRDRALSVEKHTEDLLTVYGPDAS